ncbi:MAG: TonB-dependent receptor [Xanthomonadaceae bacterium]|nr:TonB-dependent receptor [Xanthomonadaceae bacterium]
MSSKVFGLERSRLSAALFAALVMPVTGLALAQNAAPPQTTPDQAPDQTTPASTKAANLDKIVVTGSLIPQTTLETAKPVLVISAQDLKTRGFTSVQDALHQTSFATGGTQGNQTQGSFTQGVETNSLFGLDPGYTKYLIDGRPMADYPALYNGSSMINNISGIPVDLVERIEILPGGQSSLYGSDAIAGVVNIILKKKIEGTILSGRLGGYDEGGGTSQRASLATSFASADGRFNVLFGIQLDHSDPIWGYQRDLTKQFNVNGATPAGNPSPPVASRDFLVIGYYSSYNFLDPNNCDNVSSGFGGTEGLQTRAGRPAPYCGSFYTPGYATVKDSKLGGQIYSHATFDINDNVQLYGDVLYSSEKTKYHVGSQFTWWGSSVEFAGSGGYYFDPNIGDFMQLQRSFMPEDMGGWERSMNSNSDRAYAVTLGADGTLGSSNWDYDIGFTRTEYNLTENNFVRLAGPINDYFNSHVLGPQQGTAYGYPVFTPNYAAFYQLIPQGDFDSFTSVSHSRSRTYDNMVRAQVTNGSLFTMGGGDAGIALAVEGGSQGWSYNPDPLLIPDPVTLESQVWGLTSVSGSGSRSRSAVVAELRLPIFKPLTLSMSGRYDRFDAGDTTFSKPTYNLGIEYRPFESLLFRGQYGTSFKSPTLSDEFQGASGFYSSTQDYLYCHAHGGYGVGEFDQCYADPTINPVNALPEYFGTQSGNPELKPITAKNWSYGVVWAPSPKFSVGADYHHWNIRNEVALQSVDRLMQEDLNCTPVAQGGTGALDPNSGECQAAFAAIVRNNQGVLQTVHVTKINVAREVLDAVTLDTHYVQSLGGWGDLNFRGSWTRDLKHDQQTYPEDDVINLLNNGYYSRDPHYRANASLAWSKDPWTVTVYGNYIGPTGNSIAWNDLAGFDAVGGGHVGSYTTYNASVQWDVTPDFQVSFITTNLFNRMPDMDTRSYTGLSGAPYNSDMFDVYGRAYYLEARWNFGKTK